MPKKRGKKKKRKIKLFKIRASTQKSAKNLAKYALKRPKLSSITTIKTRKQTGYFGEYHIEAEGMKRDVKGETLQGRFFVSRKRRWLRKRKR